MNDYVYSPREDYITDMLIERSKELIDLRECASEDELSELGEFWQEEFDQIQEALDERPCVDRADEVFNEFNNAATSEDQAQAYKHLNKIYECEFGKRGMAMFKHIMLNHGGAEYYDHLYSEAHDK